LLSVFNLEATNFQFKNRQWLIYKKLYHLGEIYATEKNAAAYSFINKNFVSPGFHSGTNELPFFKKKTDSINFRESFIRQDTKSKTQNKMLRTKNKTLFKFDNPLWLLISLVGTLLAHPLLEEQLAKPIFTLSF